MSSKVAFNSSFRQTRQPMQPCLFCEAVGPYSSVEHVIPESLGNDRLVLRDEVCDSCNSYFGQSIEQYALNKTPLAFWRVFLGIKTKRKKEPSADLSQPSKQKGVFPAIHPAHDDVGFTAYQDGSVSVDVHDGNIMRKLFKGKGGFKIVMTPKTVFMLGRFLCKVGIELLCIDSSAKAREARYDSARNFVRYGKGQRLWPIFHYSSGKISDLKKYEVENGRAREQVTCYSYSLANFRGRYTLFGFSMGTDNWIISLDDPYPTPEIREVVPNGELRLIWYADKQW